MSDNKIEYHLNNALVSKKNTSYQKKLDNSNVISTGMTNFHYVLLAIFLSFLIMVIVASQAKIDIAVSIRGELLLESDAEKIQHLEGGILEDLFVRKGDIVFTGQPIAKLKSIEHNSQLDKLEEEIIQLELDNIRYQSLRDMQEPLFDKYQIKFPNLVKINFNTWEKEFKKNTLNENLIKHDIEHKSSLIISMTNRKKSAKYQLGLIKKQLKIKNTLYKEEMASYVDVLNMQVQESNMIREIENLNESLMNEQFQLDKLNIKHNELIENRTSEYQAQLIEIEKKIAIKKLEQPNISDKVSRLMIYSPVDGIVDKVNYNFKSAILSPRDSIADIYPIDNKLHGEIKIPRKEIGFIEVGQTVKIKLDTYNFTRYGHVNGKIKSISRSSYEEDDLNFYLAEIELEKTYLIKDNTKYNLSPYMEFTADIKTGSRKVIDYAAKPIMSAFKNSFDER